MSKFPFSFAGFCWLFSCLPCFSFLLINFLVSPVCYMNFKKNYLIHFQADLQNGSSSHSTNDEVIQCYSFLHSVSFTLLFLLAIWHGRILKQVTEWQDAWSNMDKESEPKEINHEGTYVIMICIENFTAGNAIVLVDLFFFFWGYEIWISSFGLLESTVSASSWMLAWFNFPKLKPARH